ncbi:MAG TPA: hypothetical protein VFO76_05775 [Candidatus Kapabacteria bacterium]|nr:hypothetical protein [Candidatus Kapabacteria bacterium]
MKYVFLAIAVIGLIFADSSVIAKTPKSATQTITGTLADKMCAKRLKSDATKLASHTKMCMTEEMCATSGYGVVSNGTFYKFDKKGDQLAADFLKTSSKDNDIQVEVVGTVSGETMKVTSLKAKS